jgi:hypothetical protein
MGTVLVVDDIAGNCRLDKPFTQQGLREAVALLLFSRTTL